MKTSSKFPGPLGLAAALGSLSGLLLISVIAFLGSGPGILFAFGAIGLACIVAIRAERIERFGTRFGIAMGSFVLSTIMAYIAVGMSPNTALLSFGEHSWRVLLIVAASALVSLPVARLSRNSIQMAD
ncbi:MAG: hypothetical protein AAGN66_23995 [Acidobacteriota bacterium]